MEDLMDGNFDYLEITNADKAKLAEILKTYFSKEQLLGINLSKVIIVSKLEVILNLVEFAKMKNYPEVLVIPNFVDTIIT